MARSGSAFRALHRPGEPFVLANAWDIGSARILAALGAEAIGTTSGGYASTLGLPDGARISRRQALDHAAALARATPLPVSADLENGYGESPDAVAETIRLAAKAGLAGASIEDTALPGLEAYGRNLAVARVKAAAAAASGLKDDFVLVARADGLMTGAYDYDEALARVQAYAEAGADCVYIPMLPDLAAVREVCVAVKIPVNVLPAGPLVGVSREAFASAGVARISLGSALARLTQATLIAAAQEVLDNGDFSRLGSGARGADIDEMLKKGGAL